MAHVSTVTIAAGQVPADQTAFPVLLPTPASDSAIWTTATSSGGDIQIFASDGTTEWAREIVSFDATAKTCEIWVKVPFLSSSSDTEIQIHADGASSDYAVTATYGRNAVWADYKRVYHLGEPAGSFADSTGSGSDGAAVGTITRGVAVGSMTGISLGASSGHSNYVNAATAGQVVSTRRLFSAWVDLAATQLDWVGVCSDGGPSRREVETIYLQRRSDNPRSRAQPNTGDRFISGPGVFPMGSLAKISVLLDTASTTNEVRWYIDGALVSTDSRAASSGSSVPTSPSLKIGNTEDGSLGAAGSVANVTLLDTNSLTVSDLDDWITTEYNNQSAPNTFATWVDEAAGTPTVVETLTELLNVTGQAPTVVTTDNKTVETQTGSLNVQGYAPTVSTSANLEVDTQTGSLTVSGHAPAVSVGNALDVNTQTGTVTVQGYAPTVVLGENQTVTPGTGSVVVSGYSPAVSVTDNKNYNTQTGNVQVVGYSPTILVGNFVLMKVWNGTWVTGVLKRWTGTEWTETHNLKKWNGSSWVGYKV